MTNDTEETALTYFDREYNCAQSVLRAILEHKGLYFDQAPLIAAGFGGGITYSGQQCGAISGAMMAIGVLVGKQVSDIQEHKKLTYQLTADLLRMFTEKFGDFRCDDLTEIDMSSADALKKAREAGVFMEVCPKFLTTAIRLVLEMFPDLC